MIPLKLSLWFLGFLHFSEAAAGFYKNFTFMNEDGFVEMALPEIQGNRIRLNSISCQRIIQQKNPSNKCIINQKIYSYDDPSDIISNRFCTVDFGSGTFARAFQVIQLASLGEDRIIYDIIYTKVEFKTFSKNSNISKDRILHHRKFQIVNMNNCQLINDVSVKVKSHGHDYIANSLLHPDKSGKFDIFYKNSTSCSNLIGRESYDRDGNLVADPNCILNNVKGSRNFLGKRGTNFMSFSNDSYFVFDVNDYRLSGYLLGYMKNDTKRIFSDNSNYHFDPTRLRFSTQHNRITYCVLASIWYRYYEASVICNIYDIATAEENQLSLVYPYEIHAFEIMNLRNGDFLTLSCSKVPYMETYVDGKADKDVIMFAKLFEGKNYYLGWRTFELRRYTNNGTMKGKPIKFNGFACQSSSKVKLVEDGENRVCASFSCKIKYEGKDQRNKIEYTIGTKCVELEDQII